MEDWTFFDELSEADWGEEEEEELEAYNEVFSSELLLEGKNWESQSYFFSGIKRYVIYTCGGERKLFRVWGDQDENMEEVTDERELSRLYGERDAFYGV